MTNATEEIAQVQRALETAWNHFNWTTEPAHGRFALDSSIYTLTAAELTLRAALGRYRTDKTGGKKYGLERHQDA